MLRTAAFCLGAASLLALPAPPQFNLPDDVVPRKHAIELTVDPNRDTFSGSVRIEVELRSATAIVWVHAKNLTARQASVAFAGRTYTALAQPAGGEFLGLELDSAIGPGPAVISIAYEGRMDEKALAGPYRRKVDGQWYVYTTFTPIDARRAFPCFDEPRFKTPWEIALHVRRGQRAFSNGRQLSEADEPGGWKLIRFAATEPLAAEVVAFAVGPFDVLDGAPAGHGTPIRVITAKGHAAEGKTAAQATLDVLPRLEAYTGIPYPFGKLDHLALPEGTFSAVENPGLITYRAANLLLPSNRAKEIRNLEAHEIGHQWFGDMVTQFDWDDVWLSEGFATWFAAKIMGEEQPPQREHLAAVAARERTMAADASRRLRPVRVEVTSREIARDIYDRIVYDKGAAILQMLEGWLGEDRFRDGLRGYLQAHRFGNATTDDLAAALHTASGIDPARVIHAFLDSGGVPRISADMHCDRGTAPSLRISKPTPGPVPVCWRADHVASTCAVVEGPSSEIDLPPGTACPAWFYLNSDGSGYYRSVWTEAPLAALPNLTAAERLTLVYDLRGNKAESAHRALQQLMSDPEPEIAAAARDSLK